MIDLAPIRARIEATKPMTCLHVGGKTFGPCESCGEAQDHALSEFRYHARTDVPAMVDEIERLRGLVGRAETAGSCCSCGVCPWCGRDPCDGPKHHDSCTAFASEGVVR